MERIGKISWKDKIRNDEVLAIVNEERCVNQNNNTKKEELDRTCAERKWVIEGYDGRENGGEKTGRQTQRINVK